MKIKHSDLDIPLDNPFKNCQLERQPYAKILTEVVKTYSDGFVFSLNNAWGTGKTTFIKMWKAHLESENFKAIYFNAWENDFDSNPLVALMAELESLTGGDKSNFKSLAEKAAILSKNILPILLRAVASKYLDPGVALELVSESTKGASEILEKEIKTYSEKKKGLCEFRDELQKYIQESIEDKPLIWIIDELDRCRPNYAVEVLEQIKHFFSVPGIVFVLSIDKEQLGNAIRGVYGSEKLNSDEYLRRFIDLEFVLPEPDKGKFTKYLYHYYGFDDYFSADERKKYRGREYESDNFLKFASLLFEGMDISLRQQEKLFAHSRITLNTFSHGEYFFPVLFLFLIYVREYQKPFFKRLFDRKDSPQVILDELKRILPESIISQQPREFQHLEVLLIKFYNNYYRENNYKSELISDERDSEGKKTLNVKPIFDSSYFLSLMEHYSGFNGGEGNLGNILKKINLMSNFQVTSSGIRK